MKTPIITLLLLISISLFGQDDLYKDIKENELFIPSSPAFSMLGVNPEMVLRPSDIKSFKVDWRIKNYNLAPDLALEAQPFWHFIYKKKGFNEYPKMGPFDRILSSLSLSLATAKIDGLNHMAYSVKVNLYAENDLLTDQDLVESQIRKVRDKEQKINRTIDSLRRIKYAAEAAEEIGDISEAIFLLEVEKESLWESAEQEFMEAIEEWNANNWNRTMLDAAVGRVYTYNNTSFDEIKFQKAGFGFWINGCLRAGANGLVTGIIRFNKVGSNTNKMVGLSYTYGSDKFNFYVEGVYHRIGNFFDNNMNDPFGEEENFGNLYAEDLGSGWYQYSTEEVKTVYTMAYGGNFKLSRNILLNFALRTELTSSLQLDKFIPVANVVCLMK